MVCNILVVFVNARELIIVGVGKQKICNEKFDGLVVGSTFFYVVFVIGEQDRVKLKARAVAGIYSCGTVEECYPLTSLVESLWRAETHIFAGNKHFFKAFGDLGARFDREKSLYFGNMTVDEVDDRENATLLGIVKLLFVGIYLAIVPDLFKQTAKAEGETYAVVARKVSVGIDTRGDVIFFLERL